MHGAGGTQVGRLDDQDHGGDQHDDGDHGTGLAEDSLGDGNEGRYGFGNHSVNTQHTDHGGLDQYVCEEANNAAGVKRFGDILGRVFVFGAVDGCRFPATGAPLCDSEDAKENQDMVQIPGPVGRPPVAGDVGQLNVSGGKRRHGQNNQRNQGYGRQNVAQDGAILETEPVHQEQTAENYYS